MEDDQYTRPRRAPLPRYQNPPSVTVPRSQFASRPGAYHSTTNNPRPRNFSSPFRTPVSGHNQTGTEHQQPIVNQQDNDNTQNQLLYPQRPQRSSYALFETRAPSDPSKAMNSTSSNPFNKQKSSEDQSGVVRQASIGHKAKPALLNVKRTDSTRANKSYEEPRTPPTAARAATIEALNNAIAAAVRNPVQQATQSSLSRNTSKTRMPFDSPTSTYSQDFRRTTKSQAPAEDAKDREVEGSGRVSPLDENEKDQVARQEEQRRLSSVPALTPHSEKSAASTNPLLGLGIEQQDMATRVPQESQPPKLDMKAVRDVDSRGSVTSLPDLIRRATKLAANLDRGKTASRFGVWDMFTNFDHLNTRNRDSAYADSVDGPVNGASKKPRPTTMWPTESKEFGFASEDQVPRSQKQPRICCGLSVAMFIFVLVILIILIAAAILIPIFLVAVPRQHQATSTNLARCPTSHPCQNNGISIVDNNACSCICVAGFTGHDCSKPTDDNCATATIVDSFRTYENATLGTSIITLLQEAESKMNIPLNASVLLSVFSNYNLSCASENSLVRFDTNARRNQERFVIIPGLSDHVQPTTTMKPTTVGIAARQNPTQTANDVVFQSSSSQGISPTSTTSNAVSATSASSTAVPTRANVTANQLEFAGLVVLFVLTKSRVPSTAVVAQQNIEQYFRAGALASGNSTVDVVRMGEVEITANFAQLAIILSDGKIIGGTSLSG